MDQTPKSRGMEPGGHHFWDRNGVRVTGPNAPCKKKLMQRDALEGAIEEAGKEMRAGFEVSLPLRQRRY